MVLYCSPDNPSKIRIVGAIKLDNLDLVLNRKTILPKESKKNECQ